MSSLLLMRHGQAAFGEARYDLLSAVGVAQAEATGAWMRGRGDAPMTVWHGPRQRQAETAARVLAEWGGGPEAVLVSGLDEFAEGEEVLDAACSLFGRPMSGAAAPERREQLRCYEAAYEAWSRAELEIPRRASYSHFRAGVREWLRDVTEGPSGQRILAVTSGGVIAAAVCETLELPDVQWCALVRMINNASMTEIVYSRGRMALRTFNSVAHLPHRLTSPI